MSTFEYENTLSLVKEENNHTNFGFLALALRQRLIKRWSLMHSIQTESVLEHSAIVAFLSLMAGNLSQGIGRKVDISRLLAHALLHDISEILTGHVVTPIKKANKVIEAQFKALEEKAQYQLLKTVPGPLVQVIAEAFSPGKYEEKLVKACDIYAAYLKCKSEVAMGNVLEYRDALNQLEKKLIQVKDNYPEIAMLDNWFGSGIDFSVDKLLSSSIIE